MPDKDGIHPFMAWWAGLKRLDAIALEGKDFILSDAGGKRFAIGVRDSMPLLCWLPEDRPALEGIRWTSAALAFGLKGRDWVALSATDIRVMNAASLNPVPARLFIPVSAGRLDAWRERTPQRLALAAMSNDGGKPVHDGDVHQELPLKLLAR